MLRSSRIPPLLSRVTGDGIHTAILITTDGELLGSVCTKNEPSNVAEKQKGKPASLSLESSASRNLSDPSSSSTASTSSLSSYSSLSSGPLEIESAAALVAEVMSDYRRVGHELLLLNFSSNDNNNRRRDGRLNNSNRENQDSVKSAMDRNSLSEQEREGTDQVVKDRGSILSCLLLEMDIVRLEVFFSLLD